MKQKEKTNIPARIIFVIMVVIFAVSAFVLLLHLGKDYKAQHDFSKLQVNDSHDLVALHKKNHDIVGWIKVKGTRIDYPVMQTPKNPEFYLRRNFEKKYSIAGTPFLDAASDVDKSKNFLIYGHNIKSGTMFHQLLRYEKQNFYNNHKTFTYDQLVRGQQVNGTYEVIAAFRTQIFPANSKAFKYNHYPLIIDQKKYERYVKDCISRSSVDTGKTADWDKQMVTLSTCAYHVENGRFVVVGARIN